MVVYHIIWVVAKHEGRSEQNINSLQHCLKYVEPPDYEKYPEECDEHVDDIKHFERFLQEYPSEDDDPDGRARGDHVDIPHGHVLQSVEDNQEMGSSEHRATY